MKVKLSHQAKSDVDAIHEHIAADNPDAADKLVASFAEVFQLISEQPRAGALRENLGRQFRVFPVGNYLVFYVVRTRWATVLRIIHGARSIGPAMFRGR